MTTKLLYICDNKNTKMHIKTDYSLSAYNTFQLSARANYFVDISSIEDLKSLTENQIFIENKKLILGGGSNILFANNFRGIVIHPKFMGIEQINESNSEIFLRVGSGVVWDNFVKYAVENNWGGIENLSKIPGNVGASPIQNIGAYGVEVRDVIDEVEGFHLSTKKFQSFSNKECLFGYRSSIFKQTLKNDFLVTSVIFRLSKPPHELKTQYGIIDEKLQIYPEKSISTLRKVVSSIREMKLPDPEKIGNAGSFFKNPFVNPENLIALRDQYPDIPSYPASNRKLKLSAAWLIDNAKCKGISMGNAGTHNKQPLVIVNLGNATGKEIIELSEYIQEKVREKFGINLEPEVNIL